MFLPHFYDCDVVPVYLFVDRRPIRQLSASVESGSAGRHI